MSKSSDSEKKDGSEEAAQKGGLLNKIKNMVPETLRDKKFWLGTGFTALATYIFSPLAMAGGAFVGGMMGAKAASKYDNPSTPKMNFVRKIFGAAGGALLGAAIVFGCAFFGGLIGGPVGAIIGAGIGAALTYKASSNIVSKYAAPKTPETKVAQGKKVEEEHTRGKEREVKQDVAQAHHQAHTVAGKLHGAHAELGGSGAHHTPTKHQQQEREH